MGPAVALVSGRQGTKRCPMGLSSAVGVTMPELGTASWLVYDPRGSVRGRIVSWSR
jgi:hypothetical protein